MMNYRSDKFELDPEIELSVDKMEEDESLKGLKAPASIREKLNIQIEEYEDQRSEWDELDRLKRTRKKRLKVYFLIAAMIGLFFSMTIITVGNELKRLQQAEKEYVGDSILTTDSEGEETMMVETDGAKEAYALAEDVLGAPVMELSSTNYELIFDKMVVIDSFLRVNIYYFCGGEVLCYSILSNLNKTSHFYMGENEVIESYEIVNSGVQIQIDEYENGLKNVTYSYKNLYYGIQTSLDRDILENLLENMYFVN